MPAEGTVFLLDDEPGMLKALTRLLKAEGYAVRAFTSAKAFLESYQPQALGCLVLDVAMPEIDGLELQRRLTRSGRAIADRVSHRARRHPDECAGHQGRALRTSSPNR